MSFGWKIFWLITAIVVPFVLFLTLVVGPSHADRREGCDAVGGVIIDGGVCVKKESVLGY